MAQRIVFEQYDTLDAFANDLKRPDNEVFRNATKSSQKTGDGKWSGTDSFDEAIELFRNGWTEKAEEIRREFVKFERAIQRDVPLQKARPTASVVGFTPHVPNAILGLPNSMIYTEHTPMKAKVVRIVYDMCQNAGTSEKDIMNSGLSVLKIANSLERKGLRVRIDALPFFSMENREITVAIVSVKDWRQHIDIKKVAFPIAHPAMFRRLGFRWLECTPELKERGYIHGYGRSVGDEERSKEVLRECGVLDENDYFINVEICQDNGFDIEKIAKHIGIKNL